jgi:hypothetical protein
MTAASIELKFSTDPAKAEFPTFCNSLIAVESPRTSTFPNLSSKPGPDGGIDGQWDLSDAALPIDSPFTRKGWNVYQFKSVDVSIGYPKAFGDLCHRANGAVAELIGRLALPASPALYVFFTNLQLGIDRPTRTKGKSRQNEKFAKLRAALLRGAPEGVEVEIFDAGKMQGLVARHRVLRLTWFAEQTSSTWAEAYRREVNQWKVDAPLKGRETELKQIDAWLTDDAVRIVALTGVNSIGKTRLALETTRPSSPITFFADDISALLKDGIGTLASSSTRPITIVVEDPSSVDAERLARQALGSDNPVKLLMTIASHKEIPATVFGDESRVHTRHIGPLSQASAEQLLEAVNPELDHRARDWVLQQAGGNPGIIVEAAILGPNLRGSAESLRTRITTSLRKRLELKFCADSVLTASVLSPLAYVKREGVEVQLLLDTIAPTIPEQILRLRIAELETFGCIRRRGKTIAVVPPMFAAGLLQELIGARPNLPTELFSKLDYEGRTRLLERLVTVELSDDAPFWDELLNLITNQRSSAELKEQLKFLESLARAVPRVVASWLDHELVNLLRIVELFPDPKNLDRLGAVIHELTEETETGPVAFDLLTRLAVYNATHDIHPSISGDFRECFVWWYPRPFSYHQREAAVEGLLGSGEVPLRLLAVSALVTATDIPRSLSGRGVVPRRLGMEPTRFLNRDGYEFLEWAMKRRLDLAQCSDTAVRKAAADQLENAIGPLAESLPGEIAIRLLEDLMVRYFAGSVALDTQNLLGQLKWTRNRYAKFHDEAAEEWREAWRAVIARIDDWISRVTGGPFSNRLKLALGPTFDHEEVEFEGRKLYTPELRVIHLAREAISNPALMDGCWEGLVGDRTTNAIDFVRELGCRDNARQFYAEFSKRADTWPWARLLGVYLGGAQEIDPEWVESRLSDMPVFRGQSNVAALLAYQQTGFGEGNRRRLQALLTAHAVTPEDVTIAFSYGRWLENLPADDVRQIFEYIESDPKLTIPLAEVMSLYLHPKKPLLAELIPVAQRTLTAAQNFNDGHGNQGYHCDQIAIGIAKTDINAGFAVMEDVLQRLSSSTRLSFYGGWHPYLENHGKLLLDLARNDVAAAEVFADCVVFSQPGFTDFVFSLLEIFPDASKIHSGLRSAIVEETGFGSANRHLGKAEEFVETIQRRSDLSEVVRRWLESLKHSIKERRKEEQRMFGEDPPIWE